jgi:peptide/nickel transport system ATP-binding protein
MISSVLALEDLRVTFPTPRGRLRAVDGVSLEVGQGETVALVGESGCGKSATALAVLRLLPPGATVSGRVRFEGQDLLALEPGELRRIRGGRIGMVFQDPMSSLNPVRTIGGQLEEGIRLHLGMGRHEARTRAEELLAQVGIPDPPRQLRAYPHQLSGGMRQRVMIAMAISCQPQLVIADEPTTALDVSVQAQILELLRAMTAERGTSLLIISHDLSVVAGLADRVAVMYAGEIVEVGPTEGLFAHPRHPYARGLLECIPRLDAPRTEVLASIEGALPDPHRPKRGCPFLPRCRFALERCATEAPPLEEKAPGQWAACWAELGGPPAVASPAAAAKDEAPAGEPLLRVQGLRVHFPVRRWPWRPPTVVRAVDGIDLELAPGRTLGVVGESGCGKTTAGRAILRLVRPTAGSVVFQGQDLVPLPEERVRSLRPRMQMVFQDPYGSLDPRMRVREAVAEPLVVHGVARGAEARRRVEELLEMVGLPADAGDRYPHQLSGGQRQRVSIARALALRPALIVADEPTSALDVSVRAQILNLMRRLQDQLGLAYLFISHDLSVIRHMSNWVAVMYLGRVVELAGRDTLYRDPQHPYTRALLSAVPVPDPVVERARHRSPIRGDVPDPARPPAGCRFHTRCPLAFDRCRTEEPRLRQLQDGHWAACFLASGAADGDAA